MKWILLYFALGVDGSATQLAVYKTEESCKLQIIYLKKEILELNENEKNYYRRFICIPTEE